MSKTVAVVTGANKGIGLSIVKGLCKAGYSGDILLTARNEKLGKDAVDAVKAEGFYNVTFHRLDICDQGSCLALRRFLESNYGGLDVLVNNAGIAYKGCAKIGVKVLSRIQARVLNETRASDGILFKACCPAWVRTDMTVPNATKSPEEGAETPVHITLLPAGTKEPPGQLVLDKAVQE